MKLKIEGEIEVLENDNFNVYDGVDEIIYALQGNKKIELNKNTKGYFDLFTNNLKAGCVYIGEFKIKEEK